MFIISSRIINENIKIKSSILKKKINYIKYHYAISEFDVIKFKCLLKIIIFKSGVYVTNVFLYFYYDKYIYYKMILLFII